MKAEKLLLLTDVEGVKKSTDDQEIVSSLTIEEAYEMINSKRVDGGMIPKVKGCIKALESGVERAHIIDGRVPHCLILEIFTTRGIGTMITRHGTSKNC